MISRILLAVAGFAITMIIIRAATGGDASAEPGAVFPASNQESASLVVAQDTKGTSHVAFTGYDGPTKDTIYYASCDEAGCGSDPDSLERATIAFPGAKKVQLALTADGRPRLFVIAYAAPERTNTNRTYSYGECDSDCTDAVNWTFTEVASSGDNLLSEVLGMRVPDRTFALDGNDRPRFIYTDANYAVEPDHYGAFVMACESDCTKKASWTETDLALHLGYRHEQFTKPVLALSKDGTIGVAANVYAFDETGEALKQGLYYYGCKADCTRRANWSRAFVNETGGGSYPSPTWDLALTSDGRPRIAQFAGDGMERSDLTHQLIYLWCDSACGTDASWNGSTVQPGQGFGESTDLVLDENDRPRLAMLTKNGETAIAACDDKCETATPAWRFSIVEPIATPQKERPQALPFHCDGEVWEGLTPSLAIRGETATVGYDLLVSARCLYKDFQEPVPTATFHEIYHGTRLVTLPVPQ